MAEIRAFKAIRYAKSLEANLAELLTPPYDVISPEMQEQFYARHAKNLCRVDYGKEQPGDNETENKYSRSGKLWGEWKKEGTVAPDAKPALYVYEQEFDLPGRGRRKRRGFFCAVKLSGFEEGKVRAHERTFAGPKADRLKIMNATGCNLSPIFSIYEDSARDVDAILNRAIAGQKPIEATIDGIIHRLWPVDDPAAVEGVTKAMAARELFIADGHHRYETSLNFREEQRKKTGKTGGSEPFDYTLMFLANTHDEGMEILPTHRVLPKGTKVPARDVIMKRLAEHFDLEPATADESLAAKIEKAGEKGPAFGLLLPDGEGYLLRLKPGVTPETLITDPSMPAAVKELDVVILHQHLLKKVWEFVESDTPGHDDIHYVKSAPEALKLMREGHGEAAFLMNPTKMSQVVNVAGMGLRMPQKSTYFYPKIITGMVIRDLTEPW